MDGARGRRCHIIRFRRSRWCCCRRQRSEKEKMACRKKTHGATKRSINSEEADDPAGVGVEVDVVEAWSRGEAGDEHDVAADGDEEAGAELGDELADGDDVALGGALVLGVGAEGVLGLGDADGVLVDHVVGFVERELRLGRVGELDGGGLVDALADGVEFLGDRGSERVQKCERAVFGDGDLGFLGGRRVRGAGAHDGLRQVDGALAALGEVFGGDGRVRAGREALVDDEGELLVGVGGEAVDGDDAAEPELLGDALDVVLDV
mmetsp:Transcript_1970/g.5849  ORF Transcript_1970/g.5849 Transcript_1970/m.5849 type:complete len:264 (-) Transcript_1970:2158-2949(-)